MLGTVTHSASFEFDFAADIYDEFIRSAFAGTWTDITGEDELVIGSTPLYFTFVIETSYLTDVADQYTVYTGCQVSAVNFTFPKDGDGLVGLSIDLGVANRTYPATAPWSSLTAAPAAQKMKTCNVLEVLVDDVAVLSVIDSLDYNVTSPSESVFDIRTCDAVEVLLDDAETGGTLVMLHDDDSHHWAQDAEAATEFKLEIQMTNGVTDYRIVSTRTANRSTGPDFTADNVSVTIPFGSLVSPSIFRTNV